MTGKEKLVLLLQKNHLLRRTFGDTASMVSLSRMNIALILEGKGEVSPRLERRLDILLTT